MRCRDVSAAASIKRRAKMVGLGRLELPTSRLSSARSNQLSYKPDEASSAANETDASLRDGKRKGNVGGGKAPIV